MRKILLILLVGMIFNTFGISGVGDIVSDPEALIQLKAQVTAMTDQLNKLVEQLDTAKSTLNSLTGIKQINNINIGDILNNDDDIKNREWLDSDWQSTLKNIAGGNDDRYKELYKQYVATHPNLSSDDYSKSHTPEDTQAYTEQSQTTTAVAVIGQKEFSRINEQIEQLKTLGDKIKDTTDLKASSDLNIRMTQQLGYIMAEVVRMQTAMINLEAVSKAQTVKVQSDTANFFK